MSIADKLTTIAGNVQKVYEAGQAAGGGVNPLEYCTKLANLFNNTTFPDGYELVIDVPNLIVDTSIDNFISSSTKGLSKLTIKCGKSGMEFRSSFAFYACPSINQLDLSQFADTEVFKCKNLYYAFYNCSNLHTISGVMDLAGCTNLNTAFTGTYNLVNLRVLAGSVDGSLPLGACSKLSDESIQSIVDGLADLTGVTTQTLTLHATVGNKLTEAQKATITAKNWTLAY